MIYAETANGLKIKAGDASNQQSFRCPGCKSPVFLKQGQLKIAHFSHYQQSDCRQFSEGETATHLLGKEVIYEWLVNQGLSVELEAWLPKLQQRPDLLVTTVEGNQIAIEYQCSPISYGDLLKRTSGYEQNGYQVIWLCGPNYQLKKRLKNSHYLFLRHHKRRFHFLYFDSHSGDLYVYDYIHYNHYNHLVAVCYRYSLTSLSWQVFKNLYQTGSKRACSKQQDKKRYYLSNKKRMALLRQQGDENKAFLEQLYCNRHPLAELPNCLFYLPTKTLCLQESAYIWKYHVLCEFEKKGSITLSDWTIILETLTVFQMPFISKEVLEQPFQTFMADLVALGYCAGVAENVWQQKKRFF